MGCQYEAPALVLSGSCFSGALTGLEVTMRESSLGEYARIAPLLDEVGPAFTVEAGVRPPTAPLKAMAELGDAIGPLIVSWNLENLEGEPVPVSEWPTVGMAAQLAVAVAWCSGMVAYADSVTAAEEEAEEVEDSLASLEKPPG